MTHAVCRDYILSCLIQSNDKTGKEYVNPTLPKKRVEQIFGIEPQNCVPAYHGMNNILMEITLYHFSQRISTLSTSS